eukprot:1156081-Pelagomonas_calceolata.AAC.9
MVLLQVHQRFSKHSLRCSITGLHTGVSMTNGSRPISMVPTAIVEKRRKNYAGSENSSRQSRKGATLA